MKKNKDNDNLTAMEALLHRLGLAIRLGHEKLEKKTRVEILAFYQGQLTGDEVFSELRKGPLCIGDKEPLSIS